MKKDLEVCERNSECIGVLDIDFFKDFYIFNQEIGKIEPIFFEQFGSLVECCILWEKEDVALIQSLQNT